MIRLLSLILCNIIVASVFAQNPEQKMVGDTLYTISGFKVTAGDKLKIGTGAMPDGDFKFIRKNAGSLFAYNSSNGYQGLANQANSFSRREAGHEYKVIRIDKRGTRKTGYVWYPIIGDGIFRYEVDIDNAIAAGEINVPSEFKPKPIGTVVEIKQSISVADELTKLKKLYDEGVLTKEEYDAQKKKLLESN
jgi:hypothetical protein